MWRRIEGAQVHAPALHLLPEDILQHIVTDCSTCASIAVCVSHHLRCQSQVCSSVCHDMCNETEITSDRAVKSKAERSIWSPI